MSVWTVYIKKILFLDFRIFEFKKFPNSLRQYTSNFYGQETQGAEKFLKELNWIKRFPCLINIYIALKIRMNPHTVSTEMHRSIVPSDISVLLLLIWDKTDTKGTLEWYLCLPKGGQFTKWPI